MPDSGNPIGMNQLNVEFGISAGTVISLGSAEDGDYGGGINQNSDSNTDVYGATIGFNALIKGFELSGDFNISILFF